MDTALEITHWYPEPPERVFEAWSDVHLFKDWFMASWGQRAELDFRVGGKYHLQGRTPKGTEVECFGTYEEIEAPTRIALTFSWKGSPDDPDSEIPEKEPTPVTAELRAADGGTEMVFRHSGLAHRQSCAGHTQGWKACLARLETLLG